MGSELTQKSLWIFLLNGSQAETGLFLVCLCEHVSFHLQVPVDRGGLFLSPYL